MSEKIYKLDNYLFEDIYKLDDSECCKIGINFKGTPYTFKEIEKSVDYYCHVLVEKGVKPGDHVALLGMNCYNWLIAFFAIIKVGAVAVLLNYMARHETLVELIKFTDCQYLCFGKYTALVKQDDELNTLLKETGIDKEKSISMRYRHVNFKEILTNKEIKPFVSPLSREEDSKRTSYIIFTTGTTAKPKAACLSQYSMMNIIYLNFARLDAVFPQTFMCLLPMFHCFGLLVVNAYMAFKRTVYLNSLSDKLKIYKEFVKNKCGDYASVSVIFDKLARAPFWWFHGGRFVKHCIVGGGFTSEQEFAFLEKKYGKGKFMNGYGQTECSPMISLVYPDAPEDKKKTTVGAPMQDVELAFMDPETKKLLPRGEKGEILVKGYNVFNGYYKMDKERQPFDKNGYLHTGDLGYIDEDGYLVLCGRLKDIIIRKGENISPKEIESELRKFPEFGQVRVFGFPSADEGEYIIGCVELKKKPLHFVEQKYFDEMKKTLPAIKIPSHLIYVDKFPLTANGKLDEMQLREICLNKLSLYLDEDSLARKTRKLMHKAIEKKRP
ncbi:MAG: acyl--CoA ligase [Bacilli bacterium]|nr:acyl--CoA ligase [Bacilli bacterium]